MRKILITGANSYIGISFQKWLSKWPDKYSVETVNMLDKSVWRKKSFAGYDAVFHVAGIVHMKETKRNAALYYAVNRDLVIETAQKAKAEGVRQFIFLSTMSVYGRETGTITRETELAPTGNYGKSKMQAEKAIHPLGCESFRIVILRPPMVYGKGCKGNYPRLVKLALTLPFFPDMKNQRSMIYVDNLSEYIRVIIDECLTGLFFPQNAEYVATSEMVKCIAAAHGKKIHLTNKFNPVLRLLKKDLVNKVFGNLVYDKNLSTSMLANKIKYIGFKESIEFTEK